MDLIFSFDTEDFLTPEAADAQRFWAEELRARGARGCFQCVAEVIRRHRAHGRTDVLEALAAHEIDYHTNYHSVPPSDPVALEGRGLAEGVEWVLRREAPGFATVVEAFGRVPVCYCPPGDSWTPATLLAMASLGIRVWSDSRPAFTDHWYCGLLAKRYDASFESHYRSDDASADEAFTRTFERLSQEAGEDGAVVLMSHPTTLVTTHFWDRPFFKGAAPPLESLGPATRRDRQTVANLKDRVRRWLDWILARSEVRVIDFATLYAERQSARRDLTALLSECGLKPGEEGALPLREPDASLAALEERARAIQYRWGIYPEGFKGERLLEQMRMLLWTSAPATRSTTRSC